MVRAAAKNHANVAIVTSPGAVRRRPGGARRAHGRPRRRAARRAWPSTRSRHTAAYDARIAAALPGRMVDAGVDLPDEPGLPAPTRIRRA